ncbi:MAG: hypothetical protein Q8M73_11190 [Actinomycetota bacterium]|nr:hypothetical protein [Actinomycetota bacterium]
MRTTHLPALECQASRRVTPLNQAWSWASAIRTTIDTAPTRLCCWALPQQQLAWLALEMEWACEDLVEAGAWPSDVELDLPSIQSPCQVRQFVESMLRRLEELCSADVEESPVLVETRARARACLLALQSDRRDGVRASDAA